MAGRHRLTFLLSILGGVLLVIAGSGCGPKEIPQAVTQPPLEPVTVKPSVERPPVEPPPVKPPVKPPGEEVAIVPPVRPPVVPKPRPRPKPVRLDGRDLKSLLAAVKDRDSRVRAAAAKALGRSGDLQALWPLVQLAAGDGDRKVQEAAVTAITDLGPEPQAEETRAFRATLLRAKAARVDFRRTPLRDALSVLGDRAGMSPSANWTDLAFAGLGPDQRVSLRARNVPVGVLACKLLVAGKPSKPVGFLRCDRWEFGTVEALAKKKAGKLRRLVRRKYSQVGEANQEAWSKLCRAIPKLRGERVALATAISHIRRSAGVTIQVDWKALQSVGVEVDTRVSGYRDESRAGWALETILLQAGVGEIDYLVKDGVVLVSTAKALDEIMAAKSGPQ